MEKFSLLLSIIGAGAWIPQIVGYLKRQKLFGKIISRYYNYNDNESFFLFKLSLVLKNKSFNLKEIECIIRYEDNKIFSDKARNMRGVVFNRNQKLLVLGKDYINNFAVLNSDKNIEGYLFFIFKKRESEDLKIKETTFIFESFDNRKLKLTIPEKIIDSSHLFYDDSIWKKND